MLLYQVRLEHESFHFAVNDDEFKISYLLNKLPCLVVEISAGLKVRSDAIAKILCFADIDDLPRSIFMEINTSFSRKCLEFFLYRHNHDFNLGTFNWIKARKPILWRPGFLGVWAGNF